MQRREIGTSYLLCALGFLGFAGLHRFYLGKPLTGILWLITGGLFGIGTIYDLVTLPGQVDTANRKALTGA
jgi:TM2 domain-containing membrane protein YozV